MMHQPDVSQAAEFLRTLGEGQPFTFQTLPEPKRPGVRARVVHGPFEQVRTTLVEANQSGHGVFVMVNRGDLKGRLSCNVVAVRALFVDLDGSPIDPVKACPLPPHIVVRTSPGRYQAHWKVCDAKLDEFKTLQKALARRFDGDESVCDLPRVMRLPGFWHLKKTPFMSTLDTVREHPAFRTAELVSSLQLAVHEDAPPFNADAIYEGERNERLFAMARSFRAKGMPQDGVLQRLLTTNREKCKPPLLEGEVRELVARACSYTASGVVAIPKHVLDSSAYRELTAPSKIVLIAAYRRYNGSNNGNISLPYVDIRQPGLKSPRTLSQALESLVSAGLLKRTRDWRGGKTSETRQCALYEIVHIP